MKLSVLAILVTFCASLLSGTWADDDHHGGDDHDCDDDDPHHCDGHHHHHHHHHQSAQPTPVHIGTSHGTPYTSSPHRHGPDDESTARPHFPIGKPRGPIHPSSPRVNLTIMGGGNTAIDITRVKRQRCIGNHIVFNTSTIFGSGGLPTEPSGAQAGQVIFTTANSFAAISIDGGATFSTIDVTVYAGPANPATDEGFCCDQIVHYLPSIDRFVWLIQYWPNNKSVNKFRLITFHPRDVDNKGIHSWIFLDIISTDVKLKGPLDYGDLVVGNNQLYVSATNTGVGLIVIRIPIAALNVIGSLTYWYTDPNIGSVAYFSHLSQNPGDTVFWAGHSTIGTTMRIFKWPESGTMYFWNGIRINDWPSDSNNFVSPCPRNNKTSWVFSAQFHDIIGVTRRSTNEVWFSWPAPNGGGFPNLHIQIAQIDPSKWPTLRLIKQWQIWNPDFAFAYPSLYTNGCGDVGVAVAFGGGQFNPTSAVGVADSDGVVTQTVYYPELSDVCEDRFGDYLTVRQGVGMGFAGFVYAEKSTNEGTARHPRFLEFRRG